MKISCIQTMNLLSIHSAPFALGIVLGFPLLGTTLEAQTAGQEISLSAGWNSVWLEIEPVYQTGDTVLNDPALPGDDETLAAGDARIGQSKAPEDVFTNPAVTVVASPKPLASLSEFFGSEPGAIGTFNQDQWEQWLRTDPTGTNNLASVSGNRPYLVKVAPATPTFGFTVTGKGRFHRPTWTPDRFNLLGFGIKGEISFQNFFSPSGTKHPVNRIYSLALNGNWVLVSPSALIKDDVAYWIFCSGPSDYMGPVSIDFGLSALGTLNFGSPADAVSIAASPTTLSLDLQELVITNLGAGAATPTLDLITADPGAGSLGLHVVEPASDSLSYVLGNTVDTTAGESSAAPLGEAIASGSTEILTLGAKRNWSTGEVGRTNLYRLATGSPGVEFWLPVTALNNQIQAPTDLLPGTESGAVAGLWVGQVIIDSVTSIVEDGAPVRPAAGSAPLRILLHSDSGGAVSLLSQVTIMQTKTADPEVAPIPVLVVNPAKIPFYEGIRERNGKKVGLRLEAVAFDMPRKLDAASQAALLDDPAYPDLTEEGLSNFLIGRTTRPPSLAEKYALTHGMAGAMGAGKTVQCDLSIDRFHRSNPFRHAYHQKHAAGPNITRAIRIVFDAGQTNPGRLSGSFREIMQGPIQSAIELSGRVDLERVSGVATLDATP